MDAGTPPDTGGLDARVDARFPDANLPDANLPDGEVEDVFIVDAGFPDVPMECKAASDCVVLDPDCIYECDRGRCVERDDDGDGFCDDPDCETGDIAYLSSPASCPTRALDICVDETWQTQEFSEAESCGGRDDDCDDAIDEDLSIQCGIGECAGERGCGAECVGHGDGLDACTAGSGLGLDDDCDGRVDEDCEAVDCIGIIPGEVVTVSSGVTYCLDVGDCTAPVEFPVRGATLSDVRIYGDMQLDEDLGAYVPCPVDDRSAPPLALVSLGGPVQIDGAVQISNARFRPAATLSGTTIGVASGGLFRGDHIEIAGGETTALRVDSGGEAILSDVSITSSSSTHTIDSAGRLVIESSCPNTSPREACVGVSDGVLTGAITKANPGGSVIHLSGRSASLQMTSVRVVGAESTAIWAEDIGDIEVSDSVIIASPSLSPERRHETVALQGCTQGAFRDTIIRNLGDSSSTDPHYGVHARRCPVRFSAPNIELGPHIVGTTGASGGAVGVSCGAACSFEQIHVAGFGVAASVAGMAEGIGVECGTGCTIVDSTIRANANVNAAAVATGVRIGGGTVLRSRIGAGNAMVATGLRALSPSARGRVHVQDSLVVGYIPGAGGTAIEAFEGRGVLLEPMSNFSALHSTLAARAMTRFAVAGLCHALEAQADTQVRLSSSVLWAPCADGYSYAGGPESVTLMDGVGVDSAGASLLAASSVANPDVPLPFILVADPGFTADYVAPLPSGASEMITERDVDGSERGGTSYIGAYDD
ncbi:MAG: hypothetical protein AB8H86_20025 [Polyangiales bacterium]